MLPLAVELLRLSEESCAIILDYTFGYAAFPLSVCEQLPLFWRAVDLRRGNTALLPVESVVAPHRQANAKVLLLSLFMIYVKIPIEMVLSVYVYRSTFWCIVICLQIS